MLDESLNNNLNEAVEEMSRVEFLILMSEAQNNAPIQDKVVQQVYDFIKKDSRHLWAQLLVSACQSAQGSSLVCLIKAFYNIHPFNVEYQERRDH